MSRTIDQQVVEMQFDNTHFERNVKTSMSTIDKLKQSLNLTGASKGLESVNAAAKNNNFGLLGQSVDTVKTKFSAMQVVGITALSNLTNSAVNAGKRMAKALTIEPVYSGFNEYELKMGSVQTIMASTGESLETVNKHLNELNEYSDKTIYSFSDMTQNIGKFTNAGVKLEDAVLAIKGISNEAALSGANANEASRAMYNFAQALSAGYVKLIDWKSIENANMATVEFKEQLLQTALECGTVAKTADGMYKVLTENNMGSTMDQTINATKNFNDSLNYQWMTTDVLIKTLSNYASETSDIGKKATQAATEVKTFTQMMDALKESAQSGWARTWEIIFGDFYEAKDLWTDLSNTIGGVLDKISDKRNNMLEGALGSSWEDFTLKIEEAGLSAGEFSKELRKTLKEAGEPVEDLEKEYGDLSNAIKAGKVSAIDIRKTLQKVIDTETKTVKATGKVTMSVEELKKVSDQVINGVYGNGTKRLEALTQAGYDYATVQNNVNQLLGVNVKHTSELTEEQRKLLNSYVNMNDEQRKNAKLTKEQESALAELKNMAEATDGSISDLISDLERPSGRFLLLESFKNIWGEIEKIMTTVKTAWENVFGKDVTGDASAGMGGMINKFSEFSKSLELNEDKLIAFEKTLTGIFTASKISFKIFGTAVLSALNILNGVLKAFDTNLLDVTAAIGDKIVQLGAWLDAENIFGPNAANHIGAIFRSIYDGIVLCLSEIKKLSKVQEIFNTIKATFKNVFDADNLKGAVEFFTLSGVKDKITSFFEDISKWIPTLETSTDITADIIKKLSSIGSDIFAGLIGGINELGNSLIGIYATITGTDPAVHFENWAWITDRIKTIGKGIATAVISFYKLKPVQGLIQQFKDNVADAWNTIKETFGFNGKLGIEGFLNKIEDAISKIQEWINSLDNLSTEEFGTYVIEGLAKGISNGIRTIASIISDVATTIITVFSKLMKIQSPSRVMMALGGFIIAGLVMGLTQNTGEVGTFISNFGGTLIEWFKNMFDSVVAFAKRIDFGKVLAIGLSAGLIVTIKSFADALALFGKPLAAFEGMCKAVQGAFKNVGDALTNAIKMRSKTEAIKSVAISLLILAGALWVVAQIPEGKLLSSVLAIAALAVIMGGLVIAFNKFNEMESGINYVALLAITGAFLALAASFKMMSSIDAGQIGTTILAFTSIFGVMIGLLKTAGAEFKGLQGIKFEGVGRALVGLALAMLLMVGVIKLAGTLDMGEMVKGAALMIMSGVFFRATVIAFKGIGDAKGATKGVGSSILKISAALLLMIGVIKLAGSLSISEAIKGGLFVAAMGAFFYLFAKAMGKVTDNVYLLTNMGSIATMLLSFSASLLLISAAMRIIGAMSAKDLAKAVIAVGLIGGVCAALIYVSKNSSEHAGKAGLMLLGFAVSLLIMSAVILLLKEICSDADGLGKAMTVIVILGLLYRELIKSLAGLTNADSIKTTLITLTVAIGILAVALIALSLLDTKSVVAAGAALGGTIAAFALLIKALSTINTNGKEFLKAILVLGVMAGLVSGMAFMITLLAKLEPEKALASAEAMGILLLSLSSSLWILSNSKILDQNNLGNMLGSLIVLGVIAVALGTFLSYMKDVDPKSAIATAVAAGVLLNAMSSALWILSNSKGINESNLPGVLGTLTMLTGVAIVLGMLLKYMNDLDPMKAVGSAIALSVLLLAMSVAFDIVACSPSMERGQMINAVGALAMLTVAVMAIGVVIKYMDGIDPIGAIANAIALSVLLLTLSKAFDIVASSRSINQNELAGIVTGLLLLTVAVAVIGDVIKGMDGIDPAGAIANAIALSILLIALSAAFTIISKSPGLLPGTLANTAGTLIVLTACMAGIGAVLKVMDGINPNGAIANAIALSVLIATISLCMYPLAGIGMLAGEALVGALVLTAMAIPLAAFAYTLSKVSNLDALKNTIMILVTVMGAMTLLMMPLMIVGFLWPLAAIGIAALTAMAIPLHVFATELSKLPDLAAQINNINMIMTVMAVLTNMLLAVTAAGPMALVGVKAISAMVNVVTKIGALASAIGALMDWCPDLEEFLDTGLDILSRVATGIGDAIGKFVTALADNIFESLPGYGSKLTEFIDNAGGFITGIKKIDDEVLTGAKNLSESIKSLLVANLLDNISIFSSLPGLGTDLSEFATNAGEFFAKVENIKSSSMLGIKYLAEALVNLTDANFTNAVSKLVGGGLDCKELGTQLADFGSAMVKFNDSVSGVTFNTEAIKMAKTAAEIMTGLYESIEPMRGLKQALTGEKNIGEFGQQLEEYGIALVNFSNTISAKGAVKTEAIQAAKDAGDLMTALQDAVDPVNGIWQKLSGTTSLTQFGTDIKAFGQGVVDLSNVLQNEGNGIDYASIEAAQKAGVLMTDLQKAIPDNKWFDGKISIERFGSHITGFGSYLIQFSNQVDGLANDKVDSAVNASSKLVDIAKNVGTIDEDSLSKFSAVEGIGDAINNYYDKVSDIKPELVASSVTSATRLRTLISNLVGLDTSGVETFKAAITSLGDTDVNGMVEAFKGSESTLEALGGGLITSITTGMKSKLESITAVIASIVKTIAGSFKDNAEIFKTVGEMFITKLNVGIKDKKDDLNAACKAVATAAAGTDGLKNIGVSMLYVAAGRYVVEGFARGISLNKYVATNAAKAMAQAAAEAAREALRINSPSKVFMGIGAYVAEGFTKGIGDNARMVTDSATEMADSAKSGFSRAIGKISDLLNGNMESQPTIRPVLDLSDVQSGAATIGSMFGNPSLGVMSNFGAINRNMHAINQNGTNNDVVSAIDKLGSLLGNVGGTSYNINGITYSSGTEVSDAIETLVRAARMERRM